MSSCTDKKTGDVRIFALGLGCLAVLASVFWAFKTSHIEWLGLSFVGSVLAVVGWCRPLWVRPVYHAWMAITGIVGWIITRVVLILVFFIVVTLLAIVSRLLGKRWLELKGDPERETYWSRRELKSQELEDYTHQF
ncbi:hypothetical protein JW992_12695 [candidate division KSB1 bacterium]|nr:hypothetical protein [candidate division KSB1 bacterium]